MYSNKREEWESRRTAGPESDDASESFLDRLADMLLEQALATRRETCVRKEGHLASALDRDDL